MSLTALRDMPVIDAYPVEALRGDHWRAVFADGERTYPSRDAMAKAGRRVGAAIRFHDHAPRGPRPATRAVGAAPSSTPAHAGSRLTESVGNQARVARSPRAEAGAAAER